MDIVTVLGLILGLMGLLGTCLTLITYINPLIRFKWYLQKPHSWETLSPDVYQDGYYRHKKHPEFTIERTEKSERWERDEPWMNSYPDPSKFATMVHLKISGQLLIAERFISLDGDRYFVPVPRVMYSNDGKEEHNVYYYSKLQRQIGNVIGRYYRYKDLDTFMAGHKIQSEEEL